MKTPIIIALSIIGVLGTAGGAMAVNAGTLASVQQSNLGNAPTSLTPSGSPTPSDDRTEHATPEPGEHATPEPGEHATPEPGDDNGVHNGAASPSPSASHDAGDDHGGRGGSDDNSGSGSSNSGSGSSGSDDSGSGHGGGHGSDD